MTLERLQALDKLASANARLDEEEIESFPASDPHADWAGAADLMDRPGVVAGRPSTRDDKAVATPNRLNVTAAQTRSFAN